MALFILMISPMKGGAIAPPLVNLPGVFAVTGGA
jgi:hypothetical protein